MEAVHPKSKWIWFCKNIRELVIAGFIFFVIAYAFKEFDQMILLISIAAVFYGLKILWEIVLIPLEYKNTQYQYNHDLIELTKGSIDCHHYYIPIKCIQHVTIHQGFFSRLFQLFSVDIHTAGDSHEISYITKDKAEQMKDFITNQLINKDGGEPVDKET